MKIINKLPVLLFAVLAIAFNACVEPVDLVTADAREGGLVEPTKNLPYKLGATTTLDIGVMVPKGPTISQIEVYKQFVGVDDKVSNIVLYNTVDVTDNSSAAFEFDYSTDFSDLISGLTMDGSALPSDENVYDIGAKFVFSYNSIMSNGDVIINGNKTNVIMANFFAGKYLVDHTLNGNLTPNSPKELVPLTATECSSSLMPSYSNETIIRIKAYDDIEVEEITGPYGVMPPPAGETSTYDPSTGVIDVWYVLFGAYEWHEVYKPE